MTGLTELRCESPGQVLASIEAGNAIRAQGVTSANERSSRYVSTIFDSDNNDRGDDGLWSRSLRHLCGQPLATVFFVCGRFAPDSFLFHFLHD